MVHVLEEDDGSGWVKVADSGGTQGLVPATYLDNAREASYEPTEPSRHFFQQASGLFGASTAYCWHHLSFFSLLANKQCGLSTSTKLKDQMSLLSTRGTFLSYPLGHMEVRVMQMVGGKV